MMAINVQNIQLIRINICKMDSFEPKLSFVPKAINLVAPMRSHGLQTQQECLCV